MNRPFSEACERNKSPILAVLRPLLAPDVSAADPPPAACDAVFTANTLHIMGWPQVQRLFDGLATGCRTGRCSPSTGPSTTRAASPVKAMRASMPRCAASTRRAACAMSKRWTRWRALRAWPCATTRRCRPTTAASPGCAARCARLHALAPGACHPCAGRRVKREAGAPQCLTLRQFRRCPRNGRRGAFDTAATG